MKWVTASVLASVVSAPGVAQDVSIALGINQPGLYGQVIIGNAPRPPVLYAQPIVVQPVPQYADAEPIYLHVPPGHEKHWDRHCAEYHACGRRVYFVQHDWYANDYAQRQHHGEEHGHGHGEGRDHDEHGDHERHEHDHRDH